MASVGLSPPTTFFLFAEGVEKKVSRVARFLVGVGAAGAGCCFSCGVCCCCCCFFGLLVGVFFPSTGFSVSPVFAFFGLFWPGDCVVRFVLGVLFSGKTVVDALGEASTVATFGTLATGVPGCAST
ncbi:unnamed protein product [Dibothriocephalus latus]|uniref:Transmembrane protein n=1 Tax=Dibothriocephalus latus TaxID=60516 RepID=A0A3P7N6L2_DIBLA|nr:unnamed protein product [Dibothriocephalus latus]